MEKVSPDQFKQTFLPLHPKLYRVAYALTGNKDDSEDILQEAYCKLWNKRTDLTAINNPEAFSVTLVKIFVLIFCVLPNRVDTKIASKM